MKNTEHLVEVVVSAPQGKRELLRYIVQAGTNQDAYRVVEDKHNGRSIYDAYVTSNPDKVARARAYSVELTKG